MVGELGFPVDCLLELEKNRGSRFRAGTSVVYA